MSSQRIAAVVLWVVILLGGFVFREPAPYEVALAGIIPLWALGGLSAPRTLALPLVLVILFVAGGLLSITQSRLIDDEPIYVAVSAFLAFSAIFFAAVIHDDPERRLRVIASASITAGILTTVLGIIGYLGLTGGLFTRYGRAAGGFEDPNVFGPFVALALAFSVSRLLGSGVVRGLLYALASAIMFVGALLSFSRAAWALSLVAPAGVFVLAFLNERRPRVRVRFVAVALLAGLTVAGALVATLSIPSVADLFSQRAQLEQDYDSAEGGRFARHLIGFRLMAEHPLGMGALEFGRTFGEDEHNIWLKTLTSYGWLGFLAYLTLTLATLARALPLLFRDTVLRPYAQAVFPVYLGHVAIAWVIDIDHWRHVWLIIGLLWGMIAADVALRRRLAAPSSPRRATVPTIRIAPRLYADYSTRGSGA